MVPGAGYTLMWFWWQRKNMSKGSLLWFWVLETLLMF